MEQWNGSDWAMVSVPLSRSVRNSALDDVECLSRSRCIAVGQYASTGSTETLVEQWNGRSWSIVSSPNPGGGNNVLNSVSCISSTLCFTAGDYNAGAASSYGFHSLIERWDGSSWSLVGSPNTSSSNTLLNGANCMKASRCFAAGDYGMTTNRTLVESWNGASWAIVDTPNTGALNAGSNVFNDMTCSKSTDCFAVGSYPDDEGTDQTLIER
jgi:hypothetical protein